jgi:glycosyltransferase involved in cell wall biosynthesis
MISVIISTYNGEKTLPLQLEAFRRLIEPPGGWRLIIVDNNSKDRTAEILAGYLPLLPLEVLFEPRQGTNPAKNRGIDAATGDLYVFTDDDTIPDPDWLVVTRAAVDAHPEHDMFGGQIEPHWMQPPPEWVPRLVDMGPVFAVHDAPPPTGPASHKMLWGPNMAIRARVFEAGHRYDPTRGPNGTATYMMGSESELCERLAAAGYTSWFTAESRVKHIVRPHQLDKQWIWGRAYRYARHQAASAGASTAAEGPLLAGVPRWMWRKYLRDVIVKKLAPLWGDFDAHFRAGWDKAYFEGYREQRLLQARTLG